MRVQLLILSLLLLFSPALAESVTLDDAGIRFILPSGFKALSKSGKSAVYVNKKADQKISIATFSLSKMKSPQFWLDSAKKREAKRNIVSELEVKDAHGAYLSKSNDAAKKKFWGRIGIYGMKHRYDITFMADPKDHQKTETLARRLASSVSFF